MDTHILLGLSLVGAASLLPATAPAQTPPPARYRAEIVAAARRDLSTLRACYEGARPEARRAWERLRALTLVVNPDGTVASVAMDPAGAAPGVESCVRPIVLGWRLSAPGGGAPITLSYPRADVRRTVAAERAHH